MTFSDSDFASLGRGAFSTKRSLQRAQSLQGNATVPSRTLGSKDVFMGYKSHPHLKRSNSAQSINCQKLARTLFVKSRRSSVQDIFEQY